MKNLPKLGKGEYYFIPSEGRAVCNGAYGICFKSLNGIADHIDEEDFYRKNRTIYKVTPIAKIEIPSVEASIKLL